MSSSPDDQVPSVRKPAELPDGVSQATIGVRGGLLRSGFEGNLDDDGHRGSTGWKAVGLPWKQS
jgi:hypothetical protein